MRKLVLLIAVFLAFTLLALPSMAVVEDPVSDFCDFDVTIAPIDVFDIDCFISSISLTECDDFQPFYNIGYIAYDVCTNNDWELTGYWVDDFNGEENSYPVPDDWIFLFFLHLKGYSYFAELMQDEATLMDSGECDKFFDRKVYFLLMGPDECDLPGKYSTTFWFFLGPA